MFTSPSVLFVLFLHTRLYTRLHVPLCWKPLKRRKRKRQRQRKRKRKRKRKGETAMRQRGVDGKKSRHQDVEMAAAS